MLFLNKKYTDALIEQTKTKPQGTLEFKLNKPTETFSFNPSINTSEDKKNYLAVTTCEAIDCVIIITDSNNSFSILTPGYWFCRWWAETINRLQKLLKPRSQIDIELHVEEVEKKV